MSTITTVDLAETRIAYRVAGAGPALALVGSPMTAEEFAPLVDALAADFTVISLDPRGHGGSVMPDPAVGSTPEQRADDLAAVLREVGAGPAAVLGSSGGAVTALALAQRHPALAATVVAHEPPLLELLDDRVEQRRLTADMVERYRVGDIVGTWGMFFAQAGIDIPAPMLAEMFGADRDATVLAEERFWFDGELSATVTWAPDVAALRSGPRIVLGIGEESAGQLCDRTTTALGVLLGVEPTRFPGDHTGFVDHPAAFADRLRSALSSV